MESAPPVETDTSTVPAAGAAGDRPAPGRAARTREALRTAALARFARDGFDAVNVADVADDVGVTERTFYRHFATKEEVLFGDYERQLDWLGAALRGRPAEEDLVDVVEAAIRSFPDDPRLLIEVAKQRESLLGRERVARYLRDVQASVAAEIRAAALDRLPDGPDAALRAAVWGQALAGALFAAVTTWTEQGSDWDLDHLATVTARALAMVREGVA